MASQEKAIPQFNSQSFASASGLGRSNTVSHKGFSVPDPFAPRRRPGASFFNAILATAFFRCWHLLIFFAGWSTWITVLNSRGHHIYIAPTLLTVIGTVLGFVISYRTTSSFERYNEGRRYWSQIMLASRTFARTVWFHVPDMPDTEQSSAEEMKARAMIEKKTVINLLEAYAVALKHYLRGEDGIYYKDLYYLVKFLPAYALPPGLPHHHEPSDDETLSRTNAQKRMTHHLSLSERAHHLHQQAQQRAMASDSALPLPVTTPSIESNYSQIPSPASGAVEETIDSHPPIKKTDFAEPQVDMRRHRSLYRVTSTGEKAVLSKQEESYLFPAQIPPKYHYFDIFPFSLLIKCLTRKGKEVRGKKAARLRAKMKDRAVSHNLPLEISLYLSSYVAAVQHRKIADVPTINTLHSSLNQLVDSLTGLERILTTPIPFSYSFHLWIVTVIYCLSLPFQIWPFLEWLTIPSTVVASFIFFGFLVAGEEIENPFGYDKNDLNLDHFTHSIIRNELRAITSTAPPDPSKWAFSPENNLLFAPRVDDDERITPEEWLKRGYNQMQMALGRI